jgi:DNA mismatch repair protein MSH5
MNVFVQNDTYIGCNDQNAAERSSKYWESEQTTAESSQVNINNVVLLSAPNHSGKSVYLKQVALIVYLAHIGR